MFKLLGLLGFVGVVLWLGAGSRKPQAVSQIVPEREVLESDETPTLSLEESSDQAASEIKNNETPQAPDSQAPDSQSKLKSLITDFSSSTEADRWQAVNDTVMGGISQSQFSVTAEGTGIFSGSLSLENNGGFSSVRRDVLGAEFADATEFSLRVKGDGRPYQLRLRMDNSNRAISYRATFDTQAGEWQTVTLPISAFEPVFRGRIVADAPALTPEKIVQIGFLLADKQSGNFQLEADWIRAE